MNIYLCETEPWRKECTKRFEIQDEILERENKSVSTPVPRPRRKGVREVPERPRVIGLSEAVPPPRRMGIRETGVPQRPRPEIPHGKRHLHHPVIHENDDGTFNYIQAPMLGHSLPRTDLIRFTRESNRKINDLKKQLEENIGIGAQTFEEEIDQHRWARLSDMAYRYSYKDKKGFDKIFEEGKKYIPFFEGFKLDTELSGRNAIVFNNEITGRPAIIWRGSDTQFADPQTLLKDPSRAKNIEDWYINFKTALGTQEQSARYNEGKSLVDRVSQKYGKPPSDMDYAGHSLAGLLARTMAENFGGRARVFNPASHPFIKLSKPGGVHPEAEVMVDRLYGDIVSLGHLGADRGEHIQLKNHTAKLGEETKVLDQHEISQFYFDNPEVIGNGRVSVRRAGKARNFLGLGAGAAGYGKNLLYSELLMPTYEDPALTKKEQAFLPFDTAKGLLFPGFLDSPSFVFDFVDANGMGLTPDEKAWFRHAIFGKKDTPPPAIKSEPWIVRQLAKVTGRARQDQVAEEIRQLARERGVTEQEAFSMYIGETPLYEESVHVQVGADVSRFRSEPGLKDYQVRDPVTGKIYIDEYKYQSYKTKEAMRQRAQDRAEAEQARPLWYRGAGVGLYPSLPAPEPAPPPPPPPRRRL